MATVTFAELPVYLDRTMVAALRLATREAVNVSALEVTQDARRRVRSVLGPEQRMSRLTVRKRNDKGGKLERVTLATIEKGGTRINPYYRQADSTTKPVALVGARGPAHLIEHSRRGGYDVRPTRGVATSAAGEDLAELQARIFGRTRTETQATTARLQKRPALVTGLGTEKNPAGYYGRVRPGPINRPQGGPINAAFRAAPATMRNLAQRTMDESFSRQLGRS